MTDTRIPTWTVGDRLRKAREAAGLRQVDLCTQLHVARATIAGWENDQHKPTFLAIERWAQITGVPVNWLAVGEEEDAVIRAVNLWQQRDCLNVSRAQLPGQLSLKVAA